MCEELFLLMDKGSARSTPLVFILATSPYWFWLTLSIFDITALDVDIPCTLDVSLFPLNRV